MCSPAEIASKRAYACRQKTEKREWVNAYKLQKGCIDCGYNAHPAALEFDHLPEYGPRQITVSKLATAFTSIKALLVEIAKCEVVCANCHNIRTENRRKG